MKSKIGRNEMCPCGSGIKYKKCCMSNSYIQEQDKYEILLNPIFEDRKEADNFCKLLVKNFKKNIKESDLWNDIVLDLGKKNAEEMIDEIDCFVT